MFNKNYLRIISLLFILFMLAAPSSFAEGEDVNEGPNDTAEMVSEDSIADIEHMDTGTIPRQLQNKHFDGEGNEVTGQNYIYPHDFPNHYTYQQYLPDNIKDKQYYKFGENKLESATKEYWNKIK